MPVIAIGTDHFHVAIDGPADAPALVLSNSLGASLAMWDAQAAALSDRFRVIRYDQRGHGRSSAPERPYSIGELGRDALAILDALGIARAHWCGLSMGGMTGQWLLANAPARLDRVVLANTAAIAGLPATWNERIRTVHERGLAPLAEGIIERWFTPEFRKAEAGTIEPIRRQILATPPAGYAGCSAALRDMDLREAIRAATSPVLVIAGSRDAGTTPEAGQFIVDRIKGAHMVVLEAAHLSNVEQAQRFTEAVRGHLTA